MSTIVFGIILAWLNGYLVQAYTLGSSTDGASPTPSDLMIGIGMWLGTIMWFNVWFVIWPNQQKALNIDNKYPDLSADAKAASAKTAGMFSRINTCSRSRCCSAWRRRRICLEAFDDGLSRAAGHPGGSFVGCADDDRSLRRDTVRRADPDRYFSALFAAGGAAAVAASRSMPSTTSSRASARRCASR